MDRNAGGTIQTRCLHLHRCIHVGRLDRKRAVTNWDFCNRLARVSKCPSFAPTGFICEMARPIRQLALLRETKMTPGQFVDQMRVEAAQQTIDSSFGTKGDRRCVWLPIRRFDAQNFSTGYWHDRRRVHGAVQKVVQMISWGRIGFGGESRGWSEDRFSAIVVTSEGGIGPFTPTHICESLLSALNNTPLLDEPLRNNVMSSNARHLFPRFSQG
jgi:hypothetical protein